MRNPTMTAAIALLAAGMAVPAQAQEEGAEVTMDVVEEGATGEEVTESVSNSIELPEEAAEQARARGENGDGERAEEGETMGMDTEARGLAEKAQDGGIESEDARELADEARENAREMKREQEELREEHKEAREAGEVGDLQEEAEGYKEQTREGMR
ncbi:hypothetical protein AN478_11310 [Thiohalorhabdus denitrificans]|uniref:Uncharacterized protein n=1 Tax=Thiohalorhabdus denitrificans TaxID=381306 RepID=A0A0P9GI75_9GAMM|nr:hypothetical protein [Thiohalorhabdus denitrificans]KPV39692.1 hypothetical protein AN478_11310 [Thiohalorhabdus denitrificans]SCX93733.1 hypothetical protein SAMN05661077_0771 [Thiohalorhabdus denitrificans]